MNKFTLNLLRRAEANKNTYTEEYVEFYIYDLDKWIEEELIKYFDKKD